LAGVEWQLEMPVLARMVVTMIDGATTTWLVDHDTERTRAVLDAIVDYVATLTKPARKTRKKSA